MAELEAVGDILGSKSFSEKLAEILHHNVTDKLVVDMLTNKRSHGSKKLVCLRLAVNSLYNVAHTHSRQLEELVADIFKGFVFQHLDYKHFSKHCPTALIA